MFMMIAVNLELAMRVLEKVEASSSEGLSEEAAQLVASCLRTLQIMLLEVREREVITSAQSCQGHHVELLRLQDLHKTFCDEQVGRDYREGREEGEKGKGGRERGGGEVGGAGRGSGGTRRRRRSRTDRFASSSSA